VIHVAGGRRRGGIGSNQYQTKPPTAAIDDVLAPIDLHSPIGEQSGMDDSPADAGPATFTETVDKAKEAAATGPEEAAWFAGATREQRRRWARTRTTDLRRAIAGLQGISSHYGAGAAAYPYVWHDPQIFEQYQQALGRAQAHLAETHADERLTATHEIAWAKKSMQDALERLHWIEANNQPDG
jgi:2-keto-3-deoxy-galactonokinase